jgi:hypothetical protein
MTAFSSDSSSIVMGKPALSMTRVFRPGAEASPLAIFRKARKTLRAPKSASSPPKPGAPNVDAGLGGNAVDARSGEGPLGETVENRTPATTFFSRSESAVKFCVIRSVPPNSTIAMR